MKTFLVTLSLFIAVTAFAQTIPAERLVDWGRAGYVGIKPEPSVTIDFMQAGGVADGITPNDAVLATVMASITDSAVIYFPTGKYYFQKPLALKSNVIIRGAGKDSTELVFNLTQQKHMIQVVGGKTNITTSITNDALKDTDTITVADASLFQVGGYLLLGDNDSAVVTSTWAYGTTGQIVRIEAINGNTLTLDGELRRDYLLTQSPKVRKITPITNAGIENLKINRLDVTATAQQTSNIYFSYAANCWVKCVESQKCNFAHVELGNSSHVEVTGSYFHGAHAFGGGGQGYGVMLHYNTGDCLIQENIFDTLRHSMILQAGANGNVLAYNYSDNPYWTGTFLPANSAGDVVLHGNYPYANLFEGNTVQHIVIDNSHGTNGPYNTFFRNRAQGYGFFMNTGPASNNQNIVGNEITNSTGLMGLYTLAGTGHFEFANNHRGTVKPNATNTLPEISLYLDTLASYYNAKHICPPIGVPNNIEAHITETEYRYLQHSLTLCSPTVWAPEPIDTSIQEPVDTTVGEPIDTTVEEPIDTTVEEPIDTTVEEPIDTTIEQPIDTVIIEEPIDSNTVGIGEMEEGLVRIYPNPATGYFTIQLSAPENGVELALMDLSGKTVMRRTFSGQTETVEVAMLTPGLYLYAIQLPNKVFRGKILVR